MKTTTLVPMAVAALVTACGGKSPSGATPSGVPPVRDIGAAEASIAVGALRSPEVRALSDGRLLMVDYVARRLSMIDAGMKSMTTLVDATTPQPLTFPLGTTVHLVPGRADTTYMFDPAARGFRVLDPTGRAVRRQTVADASHMPGLAYPASMPTFDGAGRLVFIQSRPLPAGPLRGMQPQPDSFMVTRIVFDKAGRDSLGAIRNNTVRPAQETSDPRPVVLVVGVPVVDVGDAWAVTSTGSVAMIRASDFHVDWIDPDGTRRSTAPVPWPWHRYSQAEKDSLSREVDAAMGSASVRVATPNGDRPLQPMPVIARPSGTIPDIAPAFVPLSARGDLSGRIWLRLGARSRGRVPGPSIYGVLDQSGRLVDRVRLPENRTIVAFGAGAAVYTVTPAMNAAGHTIERYRYAR